MQKREGCKLVKQMILISTHLNVLTQWALWTSYNVLYLLSMYGFVKKEQSHSKRIKVK